MAFIYYALELQRSMQKYLVGTTDGKKEEEEAERTEMSDLKNMSSCKKVKSLWRKNNQTKPSQCRAAVRGAEAVFCSTPHRFLHCICSKYQLF